MTERREETDDLYVSAVFARRWWKALMANSCALLEDAARLGGHGSAGRAQSLLVLSMEELAKAKWLYEAASQEWSAPLGLPGLPVRDSEDVMLPEQLTTRRLPHSEKLQAAERFASGLGGFWHVDRREEYYFPADPESFAEAAQQRNLDKQAGLYVDREVGTILSPLDIPAEGVAEFLVEAAQCVEMHLIEDHTRQQDAPDGAAIDSVQDLHWSVLPYAHPAEHAKFVRPRDDDAVPD